MIRVVVDTSVYVSAFIGRPDGAPALLLAAARERRVKLIVSPKLIEELADVLARPKLAAWASGDRAATYVAGIAALAEHQSDAKVAPALTRDEGDNYLVALAHLADADAIVTLDKDLLDADLEISSVRPAELLARLT